MSDIDDRSAAPTPLSVALLLSCGSFEGFFGGVQRQTRESYLRSYRNDWSWYYARGLLENGIRPILYIPALYESGRFTTDVGVDVRFLPLASWYRPFEQVWVKRLSRTTRWSLYLEDRINAVALMPSLRAALASDGIEHLYVQEYWNGRFDHLARRIALPMSAADHGGVSQGVLKWFKPDAFARVAAVYCQTRDECETVRRYGGRAELQSNGCDLAYFRPDASVERTKTILTVARLTDRQKRTSDLIRALTHLPADWTLDIVGTGPDRAMLERLVTKLDLGARVRFHGFLGRAAVRDRLRQCGVYAMPSSNEAVAIAALEAMGCGTAVVLSRIRAFEELVQDGRTGRLCPVGDVGGLADCILDAWEHRTSFGDAALDTVRKHYDTRIIYRRLSESLRRTSRMSIEARIDP